MAGQPLKRARERARARTDLLTDRLSKVLENALDATDKALADGDHQAARNYATTVAVLADRYHLRSGLPTSASVQLDPAKITLEIAEALKDEIPDAAARERVALRVLRGARGNAASPPGLADHSQNGAKTT